jgi:hypothetical protein
MRQWNTSIGSSNNGVRKNETTSNIACTHPSELKTKWMKRIENKKKTKSLWGANNMPEITILKSWLTRRVNIFVNQVSCLTNWYQQYLFFSIILITCKHEVMTLPFILLIIFLFNAFRTYSNNKIMLHIMFLFSYTIENNFIKYLTSKKIFCIENNFYSVLI